ncbi:hypothetical protein [Deinococcus sp.]|uniref:hypothetical protein n=1 Tax=Deinococcus sp. TaxID=47478 RepID=UPI003C7D0FF3
MSRHIVRYLSGVAVHYPYRFSVVSQNVQIGELGRAQTEAKAQRIRQALDLLERYERGELAERELVSG